MSCCLDLQVEVALLRPNNFFIKDNFEFGAANIYGNYMKNFEVLMTKLIFLVVLSLVYLTSMPRIGIRVQSLTLQ